jgi:hypothetical protein
MLPDFPQIKQRLEHEIHQRILVDTQDPLLSRIPRQELHEGHAMSTGDVHGITRTTDLEEHTFEFTLTPADVITNGPDAYAAKYRRALAQQNDALSKHFFTRMTQILEETGNTTNTAGKPFSKEIFLEALARIQWSFNDDGTPDNGSLTLVVNPTLGRQLQTQCQDWEKDPEFNKAYKAIEEQQRKDWRDRESNRRLVD